MANPVCEVLLTEAPLVAPDADVDLAGAVVDFWGAVRGLEESRKIDGIEYEGHERMAEHQLNAIARRAIETFSLELVVIHHRLGFVAVGESSVFVRVASQHRQAAFEASPWIMDELKKHVPIWKRVRYASRDRTLKKEGLLAKSDSRL
jgi:molybdopterin synthase catalytic subunit